MPNITGHTELVGLMAYPIRHTQSPTTHNLAYDKNGDDVIQLAFEVDNDSLKDAVQSIRALKMLGSNISMPNKTVVHKYLDEVDEAAKLCGAINTVVNLRDENGQVTGKLKGYNTDGMGYWQALTEEGIDFKGMKMVLIGTGGAATAIAVRGALPRAISGAICSSAVRTFTLPFSTSSGPPLTTVVAASAMLLPRLCVSITWSPRRRPARAAAFVP